MKILIFVFTVILFLFVINKIRFQKYKNNKLLKFKKKHLSKESTIERIFTRDDEKTTSDPNINIRIGFYDNADNISRKSNIHRARLARFKKSKLNGETIFIDQDQKLFKYIKGKKIYI